MRILAIDVGTGTQDILLFDSRQPVENCVQLVMPAPTVIVAGRIQAATAAARPVVLTGVNMGGGPSTGAAVGHVRAGLPVYATPQAAVTFDDDLAKVQRLGITLVSEEEARGLRDAEHIPLQDVDLPAIGRALAAFGVEPAYDALAVAVFDHGNAPPDVSDRVFRFEYLLQRVQRDRRLSSFAMLAEELPPSLTRMLAVAESVRASGFHDPVVLLDSAQAGVWGALSDPEVARHRRKVLVNVGNEHVLAFHLAGERILGLWEHHTHLLKPGELERSVRRLVAGQLPAQEVFVQGGHGALSLESRRRLPFVGVTGPLRAILKGSRLRAHPAAPFGDMMLAGCYGLVRACAQKLPQRREEIEASLAGRPDLDPSHAH
ncbi:MAG: pyruvate formate lyase-activating protein [Dehalococcoidia bacterium]|nr:pyruvate formate lyase-activating protein [Dehalococcoidia bacterium]